MFIINFWRFLKGYLELKAEGRGSQRLINMAVSRGLYFWDLRRSGDSVYFKAPISTFRPLRPLVRRSRSRLRITRKVGFPFWFRRVKRLQGFLAGMLFFIISVYVITSFIWFVEVTGNSEVPHAEIMEIVEGLEIKPGIYKGSLDTGRLERELARQHPDIAWVGVSFRGIVLQIEVVGHLPEPEIKDSPAHIVAAKDGLVEKVTVVEGKPMVAPGDMVKKGDMLIKGIRELDDTMFPEEERSKPQQVRARGEVEARVWYEARKKVIMNRLEQKNTGNKFTTVVLVWDNQHIVLKGPMESPYRYYTGEMSKTEWSWRTASLPVELVLLTYYELEVEEINYTLKEALENAREEAAGRVVSRIPPGAEVARAFISVTRKDREHYVRAVLETKENIARLAIVE